MFLQGEILKSKARNPEYPFFVMVLHDKNPSETQFKAVVLLQKDLGGEPTESQIPGYVSDNWNTEFWERASWQELKQWI